MVNPSVRYPSVTFARYTKTAMVTACFETSLILVFQKLVWLMWITCVEFPENMASIPDNIDNVMVITDQNTKHETDRWSLNVGA